MSRDSTRFAPRSGRQGKFWLAQTGKFLENAGQQDSHFRREHNEHLRNAGYSLEQHHRARSNHHSRDGRLSAAAGRRPICNSQLRSREPHAGKLRRLHRSEHLPPQHRCGSFNARTIRQRRDHWRWSFSNHAGGSYHSHPAKPACQCIGGWL